MRLRWPGMPYTKTALLVFGLGLVIGFVAVVGEIPKLEWVASVTMALGLLALPLGLFADGRGIVLLRWVAGKFSRRPPPKPRPRTRTVKVPAKSGQTRRPPAARARPAPPGPRRRRR